MHGAKTQETSTIFQVLRDKAAGQMDHILRTPKRLQSALSNRLVGGKGPALRASPRIFLPFQAPFRPFRELCPETTASRNLTV